MEESFKLPIWQGFGMELEYAIVNGESLEVEPISDQLLFDLEGEWTTDASLEKVSLSNELVLHQFEIKNDDPVDSLLPLLNDFEEGIAQLTPVLKRHGARLLPSAMHPWMDPTTQTRLWPHDYSEVYNQYHKIFNCHTHGFANVQSAHLNLSFSNEDEFIRLHTALRYLIPILPAMAASSPVCEGKISGYRDTRLLHYGENQKRIPAITAKIVPEPITSIEEYQKKILQPMYQDIKSLDPEGLLQFEWLNSRGAIARFDRNAIELRVMDMQECPRMDLALAGAVIELLHPLVEELFTPLEAQLAFPQAKLEALLVETIRDGERAILRDETYLAGFGYPGKKPVEARKLWTYLVEKYITTPRWRDSLHLILLKGTLATRLLSCFSSPISRKKIQQVYFRLADCLLENRPFDPEKS